jgi:hypothetical protein
LCKLLNMMQMIPMDSLERAAEDPARTLIIVLGDTRPLENIPSGLRDFVEKGGAVLVASDRPTTPALRRAFGVAVSGLFVQVDPTSDSAYRGLADCPFLIERDQEPSLFHGLDRIAANRSSYLVRTNRRLPILAALPQECWPLHPDVERARYVPGMTFGAGGPWGEGRILVLADHSIFINGMLLQADNDNCDFACKCLAWLTGPDQRERVLLVDDGIIRTELDVELPGMLNMPRPTMEMANLLIRGLEDDNVFNRIILGQVNRSHLLAGLAAVLAIVVVCWGYYRLANFRYQPDPHVPVVLAGGSSAPQAGFLWEERWQALLAEGNLWEPAHSLAKIFLTNLGITQEPGKAGGAPQPAPAVNIEGSWARRRHLSRAFEQIWKLAHASEPMPISQAEFSRLEANVALIQQAVKDKQFQLAGSGKAE